MFYIKIQLNKTSIRKDRKKDNVREKQTEGWRGGGEREIKRHHKALSSRF